MNIYIVDTNIVFSAVLRVESPIAKFIFSTPGLGIKLYAPEYLLEEVHRHHAKLVHLAGATPDKVNQQLGLLYQYIQFIPDNEIPLAYFVRGADLVREVDPGDIIFVALTEFFKEILWTGDKKLYNHLLDRGYQRVVDFDRLKQLYQELPE